jgi:hypothetical protein
VRVIVECCHHDADLRVATPSASTPLRATRNDAADQHDAAFLSAKGSARSPHYRSAAVRSWKRRVKKSADTNGELLPIHKINEAYPGAAVTFLYDWNSLR